MANRDRAEGASVVVEAGQVGDAGDLHDRIEVTGDAVRAVQEPPRRTEPDGGVIAGQRRELPRVDGLVEGEQDQPEARVVPETLQKWSQVPCELGGDGDVGAEVWPEPLKQRTVVVAQRPDVELHDEAILHAHARQLHEQVTGEAPRVVR